METEERGCGWDRTIATNPMLHSCWKREIAIAKQFWIYSWTFFNAVTWSTCPIRKKLEPKILVKSHTKSTPHTQHFITRFPITTTISHVLCPLQRKFAMEYPEIWMMHEWLTFYSTIQSEVAPCDIDSEKSLVASHLHLPTGCCGPNYLI